MGVSSLNSPLRWPWSRSTWVFQEISSQVYFHNDWWVGIATQKLDNTLMAGSWPECLLHGGCFFKEAKKNIGYLNPEVKSLPQYRGRSLCVGCYKEMKAVLIWYFLGHENRVNIKREMEKPVQANVKVISGSRGGRRVRQQQEESLLSVIYTKTTESICKPDWLKSVSLLSASRLSGYRMALQILHIFFFQLLPFPPSFGHNIWKVILPSPTAELI